ncbi:g6478 [Coccomyxa viridis]|uniref:G6478 protein n=1 Tax=Coccomyxa viridis TaxID=1274662 RepID=A0ABP1FVH3_9CHLO
MTGAGASAQARGGVPLDAIKSQRPSSIHLSLEVYPRQKVKRRVSNGSRPHRPHAALQLDVQGVPQAPFAIQGNPIMDNVARLNKTGLNGLSQCGTDGLQTGAFQVMTQQPINYTIEEVDGLLDPANKTLLRGVVPDSFPSLLSQAPAAPGERRLVAVDDNVYRLYGSQIHQYFAQNGVTACIVPLPTMEANKDFELVFELARQMEHFKLNRRKEPIIAIGGGVCLDVCGLAANLYRRNTPVIKVPTTLMAAIDASIGIKTAVNFENRKNKLGTYSPPLGVFIDRSFLRSLDPRNISNGAAEILKMACIKDETLFNVLDDHAEELRSSSFQDKVASVAMRRSIQGMLEELEPNLWEHVLCRLVDYGHTFSPEIEMAALTYGSELLHGEAVNIDMALTTQISYARQLITLEQRNRVINIMIRFRLPLWHVVCHPSLFWKGLTDTTKARDGQQRVPLMAGIGNAIFVNDITQAEVMSAACVLATLDQQTGGVHSNVVPVRPASSADATPALELVA